MILKPPNTVGMFHVKCFTCSKCCRQLEAGEEFYTIDNKKFLCSRDFKNQRSEAARPGKNWGELRLIIELGSFDIASGFMVYSCFANSSQELCFKS